MRLRVFKRQGNVLKGWDGYGDWQEVVVDSATASKVGQELVYVTTVDIDLGEN